jgi:LysM repeat protein
MCGMVPTGHNPLAMLPRMNGADADPPRADASPPIATASEANANLAMPGGCPFLASAAGGWRLDVPSREHRCGAFSPSTSLSPEKQARLCLTPAHTICATYLASVAARESRLGGPSHDRATRWGLARTTAVIQEPSGLRSWLVAQLLDRRRWPAIPAVLLVTTLFTLALSGFRAGVPASNVATASPGRPSTPSSRATPAQATPVPSTEPTGTSQPPAIPTATAAATPRVQPSASFRIYRVRSGDSLSGIAGEFDTTVNAIVALNNLSDPGRLSVGQTLLIP